MHRLAAVVVVLIGVVTTPVAAAPRKDPVLVVVDGHGGNCVRADASGRGGLCQTLTTIRRSGRWSSTTPTRSGRFTAAEVNELTDAIARTDFRPIRAKGPDGVCNGAFDGTDLSYTFTTRTGRVHVDPCTTPAAADTPALRTVQKLLG